MPVILTLRLRQEDYKFGVSLSYLLHLILTKKVWIILGIFHDDFEVGEEPFFLFFLNFVWVHPCSCHIKGLGLEESLWELVSTLYFIEQGLLISAAGQCTPG